MEKCNNPNCEKILIHTEGRRKKKYCSAICRNKISMATFLSKPKELKTIRITIEEYDRLIATSKLVIALQANKKSESIKLDKYFEVVNNTSNEVKQKVSNMLDKLDLENKHPLWKQGDPKEKSNAFYFKYGCFSYEELENLKK